MTRIERQRGKPLISVIVPTRGRPVELVRFVESLERTTSDPDSVELVLVVDADDSSDRDLPATRISTKLREVQPGLTMGALNSEGYSIAEGDWIFLLNDDVVVRTDGWDQRIREVTRLFHDEIALIHVNDGIFQDKLCTFPIVSRTLCRLAGGICPTEYKRYRIDDHIYHVFDLLAFSGHNRILYLNGLSFEHLNKALGAEGLAAYQPDPKIHAADTATFESYAPRRKELTLALVEHIQSVRASQRGRILASRMSQLHDSVALRLPEYVTHLSLQTSLTPTQPRVTVGVVSANLKAEHAQLCIEAVKRYTKDFELLIFDNNRGPNFNHPREMNRILSVCRTDLLVLMDDDVIVEAGWLDGMLRAMTPDVGVVTPLHKDKNGAVSYAGIVMRPDDSGHHSHDYEIPAAPRSIQTLCSAIMLIDVRKCGHLQVDESYSKYFLDIDYGLRVWEAGYRLVQSPYSLVTHIGGATLEQGSTVSNDLFEVQRDHFVANWIQTGRWHHLLESPAWQQDPHLRALNNFKWEFEELLQTRSQPIPQGSFEERLKALFDFARPRPVLRAWAAEKVIVELGAPCATPTPDDNGPIALLLGYFTQPVLVEGGFQGLNIILAEGEFFAIPDDEGAFDIQKARSAGYSRNYRAHDLDTLKVAVSADVQIVLSGPQPLTLGRPPALSVLRLVEQGYRGFNIVQYGRFYAVRQVDGPVDPARLTPKHYPGLLTSKSVEELKALVDLNEPRLIEEGYRGFNLVQAEMVYGLPQGEGAFDALRARTGQYPVLIGAPTVEEVRAQIDGTSLLSRLAWTMQRLRIGARRLIRRMPSQGRRETSRPKPAIEASQSSAPSSESWIARSPVRLVDDNYRGFTIFEYEYKFFAVPQSMGPFVYREFKADGRLARCQIAQSRDEARVLVDRALGKPASNLKRQVVLGGNVVPGQGAFAAATRADEIVYVVPGREACDHSHIALPIDDESEIGRYLLSPAGASRMSELQQRHFTDAIVLWKGPATWRDNSVEEVAARLAPAVRIDTQSGETRQYVGEGVHRLIYNKAYLASLFSRIPLPKGQRVLEVGCSDGMVCDLMSMVGAKEVVGIDIMETAGCCFPRQGVRYITGDVHSLPLEDAQFDLVVSIATFEHLREPAKVFDEILRVLRPGGHAYIQAGPLYHSPFGHHMFGYFDSYPWIHLRMTPKEIAVYAQTIGVDKRVELDHGKDVETYVRDMLSPDHLNGMPLSAYRLEELASRPGMALPFSNISYEGKDLLGPSVQKELARFAPRILTEHGFEVLLRKDR